MSLLTHSDAGLSKLSWQAPGLRVLRLEHQRPDAVLPSLPEHFVALLLTDRLVKKELHDTVLPWRRYESGSCSFVPRGTKLTVHMDAPGHRDTLICLSDSLIDGAVRGHVDVSSINFRATVLPDPVVRHCAYMIHHFTSASDAQEWPLLVESAAIALATAVVRTLSTRANQVISQLPQGLSSPRMKRVIDYIGENLCRPITIAEMAEVAHLSRYHFARSFRRATGMTPAVYVSKRRAELAVDMLKRTSMSIADVAHACGYSSQAHMNTVFMRLFGVTPGKVRSIAAVKKRALR